MDAALKGNIVVGMPIYLLCEGKDFWNYYWYKRGNYPSVPISPYLYTVFIVDDMLEIYKVNCVGPKGLDEYRVWCKDGKITRIGRQ